MSAYIGVSITMAIISLGLLDHLKEADGANFCLFEVAGMQLMIRNRATARGRMLPRSHWRLKTVAQRPSLPVRQPPYDADFSLLASFEALRQSRWLRTADGFAVCAVATRTHHESP